MDARSSGRRSHRLAPEPPSRRCSTRAEREQRTVASESRRCATTAWQTPPPRPPCFLLPSRRRRSCPPRTRERPRARLARWLVRRRRRSGWQHRRDWPRRRDLQSSRLTICSSLSIANRAAWALRAPCRPRAARARTLRPRSGMGLQPRRLSQARGARSGLKRPNLRTSYRQSSIRREPTGERPSTRCAHA